MSPLEQEILRALAELDAAIKTIRTTNPKPDLQALFSRIDQLAAQLPRDADRDLLHYLHRKSYEKARAWLEGHEGQISAGNCGR